MAMMGRGKGGSKLASKGSPGGMREAVLARKQASMKSPVSTGAPKSSSGFMGAGKNGSAGAGIRGLSGAVRQAATNSGGPSSPTGKAMGRAFGVAAKMAKGGKCRGMGAATKGCGYKA